MVKNNRFWMLQTFLRYFYKKSKNMTKNGQKEPKETILALPLLWFSNLRDFSIHTYSKLYFFIL